MKDQYGNLVPDDLVLLPDLVDDLITHQEWWDSHDEDARRIWSHETLELVQKILKVRWYEVDNALLASFDEMQGLSDDLPEDAGVQLTEDTEVMLIAGPLKRWDLETGFYHA